MIGTQRVQYAMVRSSRAWLTAVLVATFTVSASHASAQSCTVGSGGTLSFTGIVALASTASQTTDSGQSFKVRCDSGVTGTLRLYSATPRVLRNGANSLPFNLSLTSGAASDDLPTNSPGTSFSVAPDGLDHAVTMYAKVFTQDFRALHGGLYSASITVTVEY